MLTLGQVRELLAVRFGIDHTARALQNVLHDLGVRPWYMYVDRNTLHGRVGYYDPLVCWAILTAHNSRSSRPVLRQRMRDALQTSSEAVWEEFPGGLESAPESVRLEWDWRVQSTAVHLFISDPRHGLQPWDLAYWRLQHVTDVTLDAPECLAATLAIHAALLTRLASGPGADEQDTSLDEVQRQRVNDVLESLDSFGVLKACDRRLGSGPYVARKTAL